MPDSFVVSGRVRDEKNRPVAGIVVQAFDSDLSVLVLHPDNRLGKATTDDQGRFEISFTKDAFKDWFKGDPKVYLVVRGEGGKVLTRTEPGPNKTGDVQIQVKLGDVEADALAPDIYANNWRRLVASFRGVSGAVDTTKADVKEMAEVLARAVDSYTLYRDRLFKAVAGYDGIQVPAQPRKEEHHHISRWDRPVLES